jgi:hypothetical protein
MQRWFPFFLLLNIALAGSAQNPFFADADSIMAVDGHTVFRHPSGVVYFTSGMTIDCDGGPHCYHQEPGVGLDHTRNAGQFGHWWALATDNGMQGGNPVIQDSLDPAPGYYVSMTALIARSSPEDDPNRYVNAETVPYIVLPQEVSSTSNICLGDLALVLNTQNGRQCWAIFADAGPRGHLGEGSVALAQALGIPDSPRTGGTESHVCYFVFAGSSLGWPIMEDEMGTVSAFLLQSHPQLEAVIDALH